MSQEVYRSCMAKNMGGGRLQGLTKDQRRLEFCAIAKECSKGVPHDEAIRLCLLPKPPKPEGEGHGKHRKKGASAEPFDPMSLVPHCEKKLTGLVRSGELPHSTDVSGICQLILG